MTALTPGFYEVPPGMVATVVTHLEMRAPPQLSDRALPDGITFQPVPAPTAAWYRDLFLRVGAQDWLWFSRLQMEAAALETILTDAKVQITAVMQDGVPKGLLELDFRVDGECELAFFGLAPNLIGSGLGRALMNAAITQAWAQPITRFHVHTCTLDHPAALGFYRRSGFAPLRQQIEIAPDPRLTGLLPHSAGPHIPIIEA